MAHWFGAQGQVKFAKRSRKYTVIVTSSAENHTPKTKTFFSISTRRLAESVDGLNSSLAQSTGELWRCKALQKKWRTRDLKGCIGGEN